MSAAEHAIENAVSAIERATKKAMSAAWNQRQNAIIEAYKRWRNTDPNLRQLSATPNEIWDMAMWVVYNDRPSRGGEQEWMTDETP